MTITCGSRLGASEVVEAIGAGTMGEVYVARDTQLQGSIVLPDSISRWNGNSSDGTQ
jgi:hypothetical protein